MKREVEEKLLDFCVDQHRNFQKSNWLSFEKVPKEALAAASLFLAGENQGGWSKHRAQLLQIAKQCDPEREGTSLEKLARTSGFDPSRFRHMLGHLLDHAHPTS